MDTVLLWTLTLLNTAGLVLIFRQMALQPQPSSQQPGPAVGTVVSTWALPNAAGTERSSATVESPYVLLFTSEHCQPCHDLLADLTDNPIDGHGLAYLVSDMQGAEAVALAATVPAQTFADVLTGGSKALLASFQVTATPFVLAVKNGKVLVSRSVNRRGAFKDIVDMIAVT